MANTIVLKGEGHFAEGTAASGTVLKPGMCVQYDSSGTFVVGNAAADGEMGTWKIVVEDANLGRKTTDSYADGGRFRYYHPQPGDVLQVLCDETADALVIGDKLICDVSEGNFIETTGTVESEGFQVIEAAGTLSADTLVKVECTGR